MPVYSYGTGMRFVRAGVSGGARKGVSGEGLHQEHCLRYMYRLCYMYRLHVPPVQHVQPVLHVCIPSPASHRLPSWRVG